MAQRRLWHGPLRAERRIPSAAWTERAFLGLLLAVLPLKVAADAGASELPFALARLAAVAVGMLAVSRTGRETWLDGWRLALVALALWYAGDVYARVGGDGVEYYATARSLVFDFDLEYGNEFAGLGATEIVSLEGEPTSRFPIGLSLIWTVPLALAHLAVLVAGRFGGAPTANGFHVVYQSAATATSYALAIAGLLVLERLLRTRVGAPAACLSVVGVWLATPLHFYATANPSMSHATASAIMTLFLAAWLAARDGDAPRRWLLLGLAGGVASLVRIQDGLWLALPVVDRLVRGGAGRLRSIGLLAVGPALAAVLQLAVWFSLYGADFLHVASTQGHFGRPVLHFVEVLLSPRHGLLAWHPIHLAALLGWGVDSRRDRGLTLLFAVGFALSVAFNSLMLDWWGNDSFGQRRLVSVTPFFAFGIAGAVRFLCARPLVPIAAGVLALALWNLQFAYVFNSQMIGDRNRAISLDRLAAAQGRVAARRWIRSSSWMPRSLWVLGYDLLEGVWLDEGSRSMGGRIHVGRDLPFPAIGHGWASPQTEDGASRFRRSNVPTSWLRVPIRTPGRFEVTLHIRSELESVPVRLEVRMNGALLGERVLQPTWQDVELAVPASAVRPGVNDLSLHYSPTPAEVVPGFRGRNAAVALDRVDFRRIE